MLLRVEGGKHLGDAGEFDGPAASARAEACLGSPKSLPVVLVDPAHPFGVEERVDRLGFKMLGAWGVGQTGQELFDHLLGVFFVRSDDSAGPPARPSRHIFASQGSAVGGDDAAVDVGDDAPARVEGNPDDGFTSVTDGAQHQATGQLVTLASPPGSKYAVLFDELRALQGKRRNAA